MHSFEDKEGTEWRINVDFNQVRVTRKTLGIDLLTLYGDGENGAGGALQKLSEDTFVLIDTLFVLCRQQAEDAGIDGEAFAGLLDGDSIENATDALMEELCDFFPSTRADSLRVLLEKSRAAGELQMGQAQKKLDELTPEKLLELAEEESPGETPSSD